MPTGAQPLSVLIPQILSDDFSIRASVALTYTVQQQYTTEISDLKDTSVDALNSAA